MILNFLILNGYGQFVWPAFIFAFACYFTLYQVTKNELQRQEKKYLPEIKEFSSKKIQKIKQENAKKEVLSGNLS